MIVAVPGATAVSTPYAFGSLLTWTTAGLLEVNTTLCVMSFCESSQNVPRALMRRASPTGIGAAPVSYTHLTLPTIYSV